MDQQIYRFKITNPELTNEILSFSQYYAHHTKEELKEKFKEWCEEDNIKGLIEQEESILIRYQYDLKKNNIYNKIFKSIKYYYIKKIINEAKIINVKKTKDKNSKKSKKKEIKFSKELINNIKTYIKENEKQKPSDCLNVYNKIYKKEIENEKKRLNIDEEYFEEKFKKMFKNLYFVLKTNK